MSYPIFVIRLCESSCPARGGSPTWFFHPGSGTWNPPSRNSGCKGQGTSERKRGEIEKKHPFGRLRTPQAQVGANLLQLFQPPQLSQPLKLLQPPQPSNTSENPPSPLLRSKGVILFIVFEHWTTGIKIIYKARKNVTCFQRSITLSAACGDLLRSLICFVLLLFLLTFSGKRRYTQTSKSE